MGRKRIYESKEERDAHFRETHREYIRENNRRYRQTEKGKKSKLNNYKKGRKYNINHGCHYTEVEDKLILQHSIPDIELAEKIGRSVQAIQVRRAKLKADMKFIEECMNGSK